MVIATAENSAAEAVTHFTAAVAAQDELPYTEPPFWYYPTRQSLGKALLTAGDAATAEAVYRNDLAIYPGNGRSMFGLVKSLKAQGNTSEAEAMQQKLDSVWVEADVALAASRF